VLRDILQRCGLLIGPITPDQDLVDAADQVRESLYEWQRAMAEHTEDDAKSKPPAPMRRVK